MQNEFEKQMQQKMDELQIHPSESVWENVKAQITKPKRKRRTIILLFALAGIFLGGYWLWDSDHEHAQISQPRNIVKKNQALMENKKMIEDKPISPVEKVIKPNSNYKSERKFVSSPKGIYKSSLKTPSAEFNDDKNNEIVDTKTEIKKDYAELKSPFTEIYKNEKKNANDNQDSLTSQSYVNEIKLKNDTSKNFSTKHAIALRRNHKWKLGILFSGGISGVANNFLGVGEDKSLADASLNLSQSPGGINNSSNNIIPSKTQRSGAFIAGAFAEKNISKKIKLSIGINYKYFSTTNRVGEQNDTTRYFRVNNSGNKHRNSFNFIELPLSLKFQLWNSRKIPIFLHGDFVASQLINSNSLQYDQTSQSYSNNNSLLNKTQIGFNTGLSAVLFSKQKNTLVVGPDFYFSATSLARNGLYNKKHFSYIGLRSEIIFGKK